MTARRARQISLMISRAHACLVTTCIFCGRSPTTNAHIFRKGWLDEIFPGLERFEHRYQRRGEGGFDRSWRKDEADIKVGCACENCNGGWMDQLDHAAEDIFSTAAATGYPAKIATIADQLTIARWCALIAILATRRRCPGGRAARMRGARRRRHPQRHPRLADEDGAAGVARARLARAARVRAALVHYGIGERLLHHLRHPSPRRSGLHPDQ
jgi:hypothetical protein